MCSSTRPWMVNAAFAESCWPITVRSSVPYASPRGRPRRRRSSVISPVSAISAAITGSDAASWAWALRVSSTPPPAGLALLGEGADPLPEVLRGEAGAAKLDELPLLGVAQHGVPGERLDRVPVALVRGYTFEPGEGGMGRLLRDRATDLFR